MRVPGRVRGGPVSLFLIGGYTYFANSFPQNQSQPPPKLSLQGGELPPAPTVGAAAAGGGVAAEVKLPGDPKAGEAIFAGKAGCIACHKAGKVGASPVGPDLSHIAKIQTSEYIMKKILDPVGSGTVAGYPKGVMPPIFGQTLTAKEYVDLVAFLLTLK